MKDKNGIEIKCENCKYYGTYLFAPCMICGIKHTRGFKPTVESYEARIAELENKLTETIKLLGERSRECGELEAEVNILKGE